MIHKLTGWRWEHATVAQIQQLRIDLLAESKIDSSYLSLVVSSCAIATFGLIANSAAVIIGAMIIAPLMSPIRGLAFGALEGRIHLFERSLKAIVAGTIMALLIAIAIGLLVDIPNFGSEVWARSQPNLLDLGVAIGAGSISAYAKVQGKISHSLPGTAIAVALMPPVCVIGLGLSQANLPLSWGATLLYLTNLLGITLSCMLTFWLTGYATLHKGKKALILAGILTASLLLPLSASFIELVNQARLEALLKQVLLRRTVTFQRIELVNTNINWLTQPPEVRLQVRAKEPITPKQVSLIEDFVEAQMGQPFSFIFEVSPVSEVTSQSSK